MSTSRITVLLLAGILLAPPALAQDAAALRAREAALRDQLANNPFQRPLVLESTSASGVLKGDVSASVERPFAIVGQALSAMEAWCDILMLQANVKNCSVQGMGSGGVLSVAIARNDSQTLEEAYQI